MRVRARSKVDAAQRQLGARNLALAVFEAMFRIELGPDFAGTPSAQTRAELERARRLFRMAERRAFEVTGR